MMSWMGKVAALVAVVASLLLVHGEAVAEDTIVISASSYHDLLTRVENLEMSDASRSYHAPRSRCCERGNWFANYEAVLVAPFMSNDSAFIAENDPALESVGFDWGVEYSTRLEAGYMAPTGALGWRARWWHFDQDSSFFADDNNGLIPDDEAEVFFATDIRIEDIDSGTFTHDIDMDVIDLELTKNLGHKVEGSFGVRIADLGQTFIAETDEGDGYSEFDFEGVGPTMGLRLEHCLRKRMTLFAGIRGSLLYGDKRFAADTDNADLGLLLDESSLASATDLEIGTIFHRGSCFLSVAAEAQYWSGLGSALPNHIAVDDGGDIEANSYNPLNTDLGFIGVTIAAGVNY